MNKEQAKNKKEKIRKCSIYDKISRVYSRLYQWYSSADGFSLYVEIPSRLDIEREELRKIALECIAQILMKGCKVIVKKLPQDNKCGVTDYSLCFEETMPELQANLTLRLENTDKETFAFQLIGLQGQNTVFDNLHSYENNNDAK